VGRTLFDGVLGRAGKETMLPSKAEQNTVAGGAVDKIHNSVDKLLLWAAAVFRFADTALFTVCEGLQLLLSTLDQFVASADSLQFMASIMAIIRHEGHEPQRPGLEKRLVLCMYLPCGRLLHLGLHICRGHAGLSCTRRIAGFVWMRLSGTSLSWVTARGLMVSLDGSAVNTGDYPYSPRLQSGQLSGQEC
jgi:hypothetical protein